MPTKISEALFVLVICLVLCTRAISQGSGYTFQLVVQDSTSVPDTLLFGYDPSATRCIDTLIGETELPPVVQKTFDARFGDPAGESGCLGNGLKIDLLPKYSVSTDTFLLRLQPSPGTFQYRLSWSSSIGKSLVNALLVDRFGGIFVNVDMKSDSTTLVPTTIGELLILTNDIIDLAVREGRLMPAAYELGQNYPNPFNPNTIIRYAVKQTSMVDITVYDLLGRKVATVVREELMPGQYHSSWNGRDANGIHLSSGVYLLRMSAQVRGTARGNSRALFSSVRKMVLVR